MKKVKVGDKAKNVIIGVLAGVLTLMTTGIIVNAANEDEKTLTGWDYQIAEIEEDGDLNKSGKESLVSEFVKADDIEVEVDDKADVTYKIHWYDENEEWLSATEALSTDFNGTAPEGADYARVEITPVDDDEISIFEKDGYVEQVTVTVKK